MLTNVVDHAWLLILINNSDRRLWFIEVEECWLLIIVKYSWTHSTTLVNMVE